MAFEDAEFCLSLLLLACPVTHRAYPKLPWQSISVSLGLVDHCLLAWWLASRQPGKNRFLNSKAELARLQSGSWGWQGSFERGELAFRSVARQTPFSLKRIYRNDSPVISLDLGSQQVTLHQKSVNPLSRPSDASPSLYRHLASGRRWPSGLV